MPLSAGDKLGPYEILALLGSGGMGEVWKARDPRLNRVVAIKRLKGTHSARFEQEARAIAALNHPHICQIHDVGPDYLVLEYIEGKPLSSPLPPEESVRLAIQIASALEEAHGHGILHRDLKPANILVSAKGTAKLLDFGLAKLMTDSDAEITETIEGTVAGTAAYMSPEQAQGKPLDERSDVFSFGAVLYEMVSGARAFHGSSTVDVLSAILRDAPRPLPDSPEIARIVMRCLRKAPAERFQRIAEVKAALEAVAAKPADHQPSIAVLPFANMSRDADDEYFSDGLAEEILNALAHIPGLKVIARTSSFAFRGKEQDITKIAEELRVRTVLEGSVRRAGNRIRVTAQLISAEDGSHLWSERYDRELTDVFGVQDEIATAIAETLRVKLAPAAAAHQRYKPKLAAYEAYLRARQLQQRFPTLEVLQRTREYYEQAIALDPRFTGAHYELSSHLLGIAALGMSPAHEAIPLARAQAEKALQMEPSLPEAHAILGTVAAIHDYDWSEAERQFRLALASDAMEPQARGFYAIFYLAPMGRPLEALQQVERALEGDPLSGLLRALKAVCLLTAGRGEEAARQARLNLELDPNDSGSLGYLAFEALGRNQAAEALAFAEQAYLKSPWYPWSAGFYAGLLARAGNHEHAKTVLQPFADGKAVGGVLALLYFHALSGELDQAMDWAVKAIEQRHPMMPLTLRGHIRNVLQASPRYPQLLKMVNLAP